MELHNLKIAPGSRQSRKRVGRGSGSGLGTTAGRGTKGQKARAGGSVRRGFEGGQMPLYRRIPKRGFFNVSRKEFAIINLDTLEKHFESGAEVSPKVLRERKLIKDFKNGLKILGTGSISKPLNVKAHHFSKTAVEKIKGAGGAVEKLRS